MSQVRRFGFCDLRGHSISLETEGNLGKVAENSQPCNQPRAEGDNPKLPELTDLRDTIDQAQRDAVGLDQKFLAYLLGLARTEIAMQIEKVEH